MTSTKRKRPFHPSTNSFQSHDSRKKHRNVLQAPGSSYHHSSASQDSSLRQLRSNTAADTGANDEESGQPPDDELDQVIVAIDKKDAGTIGCSYYSAQEEKLYLLGDIRSAGTDTIDTILLQTKPTVLLASARVDYFGAQDTREELDSEQGVSPQFYLPYNVDIRPSQEFSYFSARNKLAALEISSMHEQRIQFLVPHDALTGPDRPDAEDVGFTKQEGRILHMSSSVDMENTVTVGCAGAILTYLQRRRSSEIISGDRYFRVSSVEMFSLEGTMFINENTLSCLQIMQTESHPNMFNHGPGKKSSFSKEGLSLYGIFRRFAYTPQGRSQLRRDFLRPSVDIQVIRERHDFISVFLRPDNFSAFDQILKSLKHIKNLRPVMINLRKGVSTGSGKIIGFKTTVWATLLAFAFYGIDIQDSLKEVTGAEMLTLHTKALQIFEMAQLFQVGRMIQEIVDIDASEEQNRTVVKPGLDRELDEMKDNYDGLDSLLKQVAIDVATTIPESLDIDVNVIYFPQLGFNIAIPLNTAGEASFNGSEEEWELIFITENRAYFKDFRMREMDDRLGDIYGLICEKEIEFVYGLAQRVLQFENILKEASDICGEIDSLLAMAQAANCYKLVRPNMVEGNVINIKGGRHLLQELTVPSFVPNDTFVVGGRPVEGPQVVTEGLSDGQATTQGPSLLLLTGPNYSGKSIYMKQVALIIHLAQVGSFVPAEYAELGITDKILAKMNTQESVSKIPSTFMNDLQQISLDLKQVTSRSLLIIDEFGKGTNENDGIGLACGILEHLLSLDDNSPKVIAATHFHEIFENGFLAPRPRLQLGHMEVQVCERSQQVENQITYLYKSGLDDNMFEPRATGIDTNRLLYLPFGSFRLGRSDKSFGTICAAMNGINPTIVSRANELATLSARGDNLIAACATMSAEEALVLEEANTLARKFLEMDFSENENSENVRDMFKRIFEEMSD